MSDKQERRYDKFKHGYQPKIDKFSNKNERLLRSGRRVKVNSYTLPKPYINSAEYSYFSYVPPKLNKPNFRKSNLTRSITTPRTPYADIDQFVYDEGIIAYYVFANILPSNICPENYYKAKYSSNFSSLKLEKYCLPLQT